MGLFICIGPVVYIQRWEGLKNLNYVYTFLVARITSSNISDLGQKLVGKISPTRKAQPPTM